MKSIPIIAIILQNRITHQYLILPLSLFNASQNTVPVFGPATNDVIQNTKKNRDLGNFCSLKSVP